MNHRLLATEKKKRNANAELTNRDRAGRYEKKEILHALIELA